MTSPISTPGQPLQCTQCGGELHPDEGQIFVTCPYCNSTVYLDKSQVVFHWSLAPTLDTAKAKGALARWMAGNQTVKDLDQKATLTGVTFEYFPFWYFKFRAANGKEELRLEPAAATSVSEIKNFNLPAGDLLKYDPELDSQAQSPTAPLQAVLGWLGETETLFSDKTTDVIETALVHIPIFTCKYTYRGETYTAIVEAATGGVFANIYPAKAEAPYLLAGGASAAVFLCLAVIPLGFALTNDPGAIATGIGICAGLGILAAPLLYVLALWVASKV
jgi:hypothetical protein